MNNFLHTLSCCILLLFAQQVFAQESVMDNEKAASLNNEDNRKHALKLNLLSVLNKSVTVSYENMLSAKISMQLGFYYSRNNYMGASERLSFTPEFRFYLSAQEHALVGFYAGPYLKYQTINHMEEQPDDAIATANIRTLGGGIVLGKQWIAKKGFTVDLFAGGGYNPSVTVSSIKVTDAATTYSGNTHRWRTDIRAGVSVGYAF